jgi:hypothetical protein
MDTDSPRARAARAKRSLRLNEETSLPKSSAPTPDVKVIDLSFAVDDETVRSVEEQRSSVRKTLGLKE